MSAINPGHYGNSGDSRSQWTQISYDFYADLCRLVQARNPVPRVPGDNAGSVKKLHHRPELLRAFTRSPPYRAMTSVEPTQRLRATATPSRNATNKLCNGACRVTARSLAIGWPGRSAFAITSRKRSTATFSSVVTSSTVRDTSVAASIARSAMLGDDTCGVSVFTLGAFRTGYEAATFGCPRQAP